MAEARVIIAHELQKQGDFSFLGGSALALGYAAFSTSLASSKGEKKIATAPFWSVKVKTLSSSVAKPNETVVYYLRNGPKRGFVREELLIVRPNTQLPPSYVI